jgi:hypothetical protein
MTGKSATADADSARAKFEAVERQRGTDLSRASAPGMSHKYAKRAVENRWQGWQSALAELQGALKNHGIMPWRQRIALPADYQLWCTTPVEQAMLDQIRDLEAALAAASVSTVTVGS